MINISKYHHNSSQLELSELINIALVDDHFLYKKGLKLAFSFYKDINVLFEAENGAHLLEQLKEFEPHVILLDLQMSGMDGIAVLPEVKRQYPRIKVIILSLNSEESMIAKLIGMGADSYLAKTSDLRKMYKEIRDVMNDNLSVHY